MGEATTMLTPVSYEEAVISDPGGSAPTHGSGHLYPQVGPLGTSSGATMAVVGGGLRLAASPTS